MGIDEGQMLVDNGENEYQLRYSVDSEKDDENGDNVIHSSHIHFSDRMLMRKYDVADEISCPIAHQAYRTICAHQAAAHNCQC